MDNKTLTPKKKLIVLAICAAVLLMFLYFSTYLTPSEPQKKKTDLARELENVLSEMKGVGNVNAVIYSRPVTEPVSAEAMQETIFGESKKETAAPTAEEICGVLIVAEGAEDIRVRTEMLSAVSALLDVGTDRIEILY